MLPDQSLQQGSKGEPLLQPKEEPQKAALPISVDSSVSVKAEPISEWRPPADESLTLCGISIPEGDEAAEASSPSSQKVCKGSNLILVGTRLCAGLELPSLPGIDVAVHWLDLDLRLG